MNQLNIYSRTILLVIALSVFSSFSLALKGDEGVPPDFGKSNSTLLIVKLVKMNKQNEKIQKIFTEYYKGKFEMVENADDSKYSNTDEYRFVMYTRAIWNEASGMGDSRMPASWSYSAYIIDKSTGKKYPVGFEGGAYGPFFKDYAIRLEKARAANAGN
jgi:hypothetical protein